MLLHEHGDYAAIIGIVSGEKGIREAILEKDYWVTVVLHELRKSEFKDAFTFKGGTSLSKGWNLIDRFSEDIDLLLVSDGLGKNAKRTRLKKIEEFVASITGLTFEDGNPDNRSSNESRTSCFKYKTVTTGLGTLLPYVKLEMGFRGGNEPRETRRIQSMLGEALEQKGQAAIATDTLAVEMPLLHPKRTLTEKLFAIYSAFESGKIAGKTRHYYDIYKLLGLAEVTGVLGTDEYKQLKENVAAFSRENWPDSPLPPENRLAGTQAFAPEGERRTPIEREYAQSDIYYGPKPKFDEILARIQEHQAKF